MKLILLLSIWLLAFTASSQNISEAKRDYNWIFGRSYPPYKGSIINFNNNPATCNFFTQHLDILNTNGSISDTSGNLLFYTNGMFVADKNGNIMPHGDSLNFGSYYNSIMSDPVGYHGYNATQSLIILPQPGNENHVFQIIHSRLLDPYHNALDLLNSTVSIDENNGLGDVTSKNEAYLVDTVDLGIDAVRHANGRDWWVVVSEANCSCYYLTLINPDIPLTHKQCAGISTNGRGAGCHFSPDGLHFANVVITTAKAKFKYFSFDRSVGSLTYVTEFNVPRNILWYGFAFFTKFPIYVCFYK
ncbi:MAG: hypothetical protein WCO63_16245 [Bacteroidota bacterium]